MGASCSTSALNKYTVLKRYIETKSCLTFERIEGFLSQGRPAPPIVLIGENHARNESEQMRKSCATALASMSRIVSTCPEKEKPTSKVLFFIESSSNFAEEKFKLHPFFDRFQVQRRPQFLEQKYELDMPWYMTTPAPSYGDVSHRRKHEKWQPLDSRGKVERFSLNQVRTDIETYRAFFESGFLPIGTDIFHLFRTFVSQGYEGSEAHIAEFIEGLSHTRAIIMMKKAILDAYTYAGTINNENHIHEDIDNMDQLFSEVDVVKKRQDTWRRMDEVRDSIREYNTKFERAIRARVLARGYEWMYHMTNWLALFTIDLIKRRQGSMYSNLPSDDTNSVLADVERVVSVSTNDANPPNFLQTITVCGDAVTYLLFLKPRMNQKHHNEVCVFYGGARHMEHFAKWIQSTPYASDFQKEASGLTPSSTSRSWVSTGL